MAHRAADADVEERPSHGAEPDWKPPREAVDTGGGAKMLVRLVVFALVVGATYFVFRQGSGAFFAPRLEVIGPLVPHGRLAPGEPLTLGVEVRNTRMIDGAAFVVAVLGDSSEVEGEPVEVPGLDTATATVQVDLGVGAHVVALVAFDGWRDVARLQPFPGIALRVGHREVGLERFTVPESIPAGDSIPVEFIGRNEGQFEEFMLPRVLFRPEAGGDPVEGAGYPIEFSPGDTVVVQFFVDSSVLSVGTYTAELLALSDDGVILGQSRYPQPVAVHE